MKKLLFVLIALVNASCSSGPSIKRDSQLAEFKTDRVYEYDFPTVWKAVEKVVENYRVESRNPETANAVELKKLKSRSLETGWVFSQSRDKYIELNVNGVPKRKYVQIRFKYRIAAEKVLEGTRVAISATEEVENLTSDGSPNGYSSAESADTSRPKDLLEKIKNAIYTSP